MVNWYTISLLTSFSNCFTLALRASFSFINTLFFLAASLNCASRVDTYYTKTSPNEAFISTKTCAQGFLVLLTSFLRCLDSDDDCLFFSIFCCLFDNCDLKTKPHVNKYRNKLTSKYVHTNKCMPWGGSSMAHKYMHTHTTHIHVHAHKDINSENTTIHTIPYQLDYQGDFSSHQACQH